MNWATSLSPDKIATRAADGKNVLTAFMSRICSSKGHRRNRQSLCQSTRQTSLIVKVQSPLARRSRGSCADRCGKLPDRRFLSVLTVLSRRCVRRRNAISARAFIAVHCVGAASLLP
ncbi:hypothetical protein [Caballeronia novacaledonica]|uniref:hypothetical protein n=1 Tax=Caballeronia novacaledonica TaxID=1544861 RepID=UPI003182E555